MQRPRREAPYGAVVLVARRAPRLGRRPVRGAGWAKQDLLMEAVALKLGIPLLVLEGKHARFKALPAMARTLREEFSPAWPTNKATSMPQHHAWGTIEHPNS